MEPWIDKPNIEHVNGMVEKAISDGAKVIVRGSVVSETPLSKGAFYRPTLLQVTDPNVDIVQKEVTTVLIHYLSAFPIDEYDCLLRTVGHQ